MIVRRVSGSVIVALALFVTSLGLQPSRAEGSTFGISTRGVITDTGHIDWATYAADFDPVANGTTKAVPGIAGTNLTISETTGFGFLRVTQGTSWIGNFADGNPVLYTTGGGPVDFIFSSPIAGFGEQIQSASFGAFTARIEAFNSSGISIGLLSVVGNSTGAGDGSAAFLGLYSTAVDIKRIRLSLTSSTGDLGDFGVNNPVVTAVPAAEPVTLVLFGTCLIASARSLRRRN